ncbi:MAG: glucose-1-phosphate cytidylyltransferase [Sporomusaceae bacterium]|jgi:glucose-1-phosphate cytidylyltransferase|nr:glucose-1-phosphate cytidylyltransferase [Sporomusaceae bacterium]
MKVVILAGGFGTRISEESHLKPKPMIEIGEKPILWHIMKIYSHYGFNEFIVCLGYKGYHIKEYFAHYFLHESDVTFDYTTDKQTILNHHAVENWKVTLVNTGLETATGGRIKRARPYIGNNTFMLTYGDGVSDVDIKKLVEFHQAHGKAATVTSIQPVGKYGTFSVGKDNTVRGFKEKPKTSSTWVNAGFFVFEPKIFDYIDNDSTALESTPLEKLAEHEQLVSFKHYGFWQPMDTLREKSFLESLWNANKAPWKIWN